MSKRSAIRMFMEQNMVMIGVSEEGSGYFIPVGIITNRAYHRIAGILYKLHTKEITPYINHTFIDKVEDYLDSYIKIC